MTRLLLLTTLASAPALAQDLTVHSGWLLEPVDGKVYENGIGSPTVAYDDANDEWVMFFETRFGAPDEPGGDCLQGRWGIGRATSPDGLTWTIDDDLVIEPETDTFYACVLAHPTVIFDDGTFHLWFKAHQENTACDAGPTPSWGCNAVTGVGYATSSNGTDFIVDPDPILNLSAFGFPTVTRVNGTYRMLLALGNEAADIYELWQSISTDDGITWTTPEVVLQPGFDTWVEDEIYNPALTCRLDNPDPYVLWAGGRDREPQMGGPPVIKTAGLGRAFSDDGLTWAFDANSPFIVWDLDPEAPAVPDRDWRHWDVVRVDDDYLLYFSEFNDEGKNRVGLAYTYASPLTSIDESKVAGKVCEPDAPVDSDTDVPGDTDTDAPGDTDTDPPTETDGDTDPGTDKTGGGCDCNQPGSPPASWLWLILPAIAWRRRAQG